MRSRRAKASLRNRSSALEIIASSFFLLPTLRTAAKHEMTARVIGIGDAFHLDFLLAFAVG